MTVILYLIGRPGVGKYTIARKIAKFGYQICDNQLINNPIFSLINNNGMGDLPESVWQHTRKIREIVFDFISTDRDNNYILTNSLYKEDYDSKVYMRVENLAKIRNSIFIPVKLSISKEQHLKRITQKSRLNKYKTIDSKHVYDSKELINIGHPNLLNLDINNLVASDAAMKIIKHVDKISAYICKT